MRTLDQVAAEARRCVVCAAHLPLGPRPVLHVSATARLLIVSQAPGTRVHETGQSFNDASGDRLRLWLGMTRATFYDVSRVAILPMGMCYPGRLPNGGDAPPRPECAKLWHPRLLPLMPRIELTLLVGSYAQIAVLGPGATGERVRRFAEYLPSHFPLPHPSWRTVGWEKRNPWFGELVLPELRRRVARASSADMSDRDGIPSASGPFATVTAGGVGSRRKPAPAPAAGYSRAREPRMGK